jgi:hypothetical protein
MNAEVEPQRNGHLLCDLCGTYWCLHVEAFVRGGMDAETLWSHHPDSQMIEVPIVPTADLWAQVGLVRGSDSGIQMYRVLYIAPDKPDHSEGLFIGFIHPPESRDILRSMILDWFIGTQEHRVTGCPAEGHGYKQTIRWNLDMNKRVTAIPQAWSVWATGKCLGCTYHTADMADLVPDPGPAKTPWSS